MTSSDFMETLDTVSLSDSPNCAYQYDKIGGDEESHSLYSEEACKQNHALRRLLYDKHNSEDFGSITNRSYWCFMIPYSEGQFGSQPWIRSVAYNYMREVNKKRAKDLSQAKQISLKQHKAGDGTVGPFTWAALLYPVQFSVLRNWTSKKIDSLLKRWGSLFPLGLIMLKYQGYVASVRLDPSNDKLVGKVEGINDLITFEGKDVTEIKHEFEKAVDAYLDFCKKLGKEPDKKYSGKISYRTDEETHKEIETAASLQNLSINAWIDKVVKRNIEDSLKNKKNKLVAL